MKKIDTFNLLWDLHIGTDTFMEFQKETGETARLGLLVHRIETNRENIPT